jgi:hypothetical protein
MVSERGASWLYEANGLRAVVCWRIKRVRGNGVSVLVDAGIKDKVGVICCAAKA